MYSFGDDSNLVESKKLGLRQYYCVPPGFFLAQSMCRYQNSALSWTTRFMMTSVGHQYRSIQNRFQKVFMARLRYREKIYINAQEYKSPCFEKKSDAIASKSVKLAEKRQFLATGVMPLMRPTLQDVKFKEFALWWLDHRVAPRSTLRTRERYEMNSQYHI